MKTVCCIQFFHLYFLFLLFITCKSAHNPSSVISRFQQYLQINTAHPNPNYYEAADFILSQAKSLSLESQTIEFVKNKPLILLKWPGKTPELPSILLNSHTDVVPVESHKWTYHPFDAHIDSDGNYLCQRFSGKQFNQCLALVLRAVLFPTFSGVDVKGKLVMSDINVQPLEKTSDYGIRRNKLLEVPQIVWGLNNQKIAFARACLTARMLNRTLLVFQFNKFNSLCNGFNRLGQYSELSNQTDVPELEKGGGRKWTSMRDYEQLKEFSSDPYDQYEVIHFVGNPFLWHDHWPVKDYARIFECLVLVDEFAKEANRVVSRIRPAGENSKLQAVPYMVVHMKIKKDWMYLEAIRMLKNSGFEPTRTIYLSYVPDEEIGGRDGAEKLADSDVFKKMNVAFVLDEGRPSADEKYQAYYAERSPMWLVIKAVGAPGHGAKLYDDTAMENLLVSIESIKRFRASEFDMVKAGLKTQGEGFVMNMQPSEAEAGIDIRVPPTEDQEALERRVAEEWAPVSRNMTYEFKEKFPIVNKFGKPAITVADNSNPWWVLLEEAVQNAGGELEKPDIFCGATDASFFRQRGLPAIGFSPIANTQSLAHNHNEFINQQEYLKGIDIYASIIKAFASDANRS
ncbi:O-fucosyltransferase 23 [Bienertia sinuspersici]